MSTQVLQIVLSAILNSSENMLILKSYDKNVKVSSIIKINQTEPLAMAVDSSSL
jgi:hypothetical protein